MSVRISAGGIAVLTTAMALLPQAVAQIEPPRSQPEPSARSHAGGAATSPNIGGEGTLDILAGGGSSRVWSFDILSNSWTALENAPTPVRSGGAISNLFNNCDYAFTGDSNVFFSTGRSCPTLVQLADAPAPVRAGAGLAASLGVVGAPVDSVFAFRGSGASDFWRYSISQNSWVIMPSTPAPAGEGSGLVEVPVCSTTPGSDFQVAALRGGDTTDFWCFDIESNRWQAGAGVSALPAPAGAGASIAQLQRLGQIYVLRGGGTSDFWRWHEGTWTALASIPGPVNAGGALVGINYGTDDQRDVLYALQGGNSTAVWRYDVALNTWTQIGEIPESPAADRPIR